MYIIQVSAPALGELLRPTVGPTAADEAFLDAESESNIGDHDNLDAAWINI
jgi:hypothetical protein